MFKYLWIAVVVFSLDQVTKLAAVKYLTRIPEIELTSFFNLTLVYNAGAAFGFLSDAGGWQKIFFIVIALVACVVILAMMRGLGVNDKQVATGLVLILGGALGNVVDRVRYGYVVDFIDVHYSDHHWPAFNVADSAITVGAILLILDALGLGFRKRHER